MAATASTSQGRTPVTTIAAPAPLPAVSVTEKHLDAALLALVRRRKPDRGILPGVPFH
jgi:hypothetical protein